MAEFAARARRRWVLSGNMGNQGGKSKHGPPEISWLSNGIHIMILVRHGQSAWNAEFNRTRVDPDIRDPDLTEEGRAQAAQAAEVLAQAGVERLLASPYTRTLQTAAIIAERLRLPITVEPLVRERTAFSCDVGTERSRLAELWPELGFDHLEEIWWPTGIESETKLAKRCRLFHRSVRTMADWRRVAVVSHWGFIRGLTGIETKNGELVRFELTGQARRHGSD
jgi:broad specificity phosphatase PhoE